MLVKSYSMSFIQLFFYSFFNKRYKSPYPEEVWICEKFFICEFCLKYIKSASIYRRHLDKCMNNLLYEFFSINSISLK